MGFPFLETIPTQLPNSTHFFGFFWMDLTEFYGLTQPMNTPSHCIKKRPYTPLKLTIIMFMGIEDIEEDVYVLFFSML